MLLGLGSFHCEEECDFSERPDRGEAESDDDDVTYKFSDIHEECAFHFESALDK